MENFNLEKGVTIPDDWRRAYLLAVKNPDEYNILLVQTNFSFRNLIKEHYNRLPKWVNKEEFYQDMTDKLLRLLKFNNYEESDIEIVLGSPLIADDVIVNYEWDVPHIIKLSENLRKSLIGVEKKSNTNIPLFPTIISPIGSIGSPIGSPRF